MDRTMKFKLRMRGLWSGRERRGRMVDSRGRKWRIWGAAAYSRFQRPTFVFLQCGNVTRFLLAVVFFLH
jgi:hypothetical protein